MVLLTNGFMHKKSQQKYTCSFSVILEADSNNIVQRVAMKVLYFVFFLILYSIIVCSPK